MNKIRNRGGLYQSILMITIVPILLFALVIVAVSSIRFGGFMDQEVKTGLQNMGTTAAMLFDTLYPGDYELREVGEAGRDGYVVMKGTHQIDGDYAVIDALKEKTGLDFTLFYGDTRIITTIKNQNGDRFIATGANSTVIDEVLSFGTDRFYPEAVINDTLYYAYYMPLLNADASCVGMMFVGKPTAMVDSYVRRSLLPVIGLGITGMLVSGVFSATYARKLTAAIKKSESFLRKVEQGDLSAELDKQVENRNDEVGEMGRHAINMQRELRVLIEMDALTQMYNRSYGERYLKRLQATARETKQDFAIALGDIDFFKGVNDTYGHECGDKVLVNVALLLKKHMAGSGVAARWGGEEFLLIFEKDHITAAANRLEEIMSELRLARVGFQAQAIGVTMTFGLTPGNAEDYEQMLRDADIALYRGKAAGRDQAAVAGTD